MQYSICDMLVMKVGYNTLYLWGKSLGVWSEPTLYVGVTSMAYLAYSVWEMICRKALVYKEELVTKHGFKRFFQIETKDQDTQHRRNSWLKSTC